VSGYNIEIIATSEIYTVSVTLHFVPEGQAILLLTVTFRKTVTERNVSTSFTVDSG
jgi:hypothetical protein